jgi:hypothetical protein
MSSPKPTVRPATPDDADAIIALSAQMDTPLTPAVFRWKYLESPSARISDSVVGVDAEGKVVGHAGVVVQPINVLGARHVAGQVTDIMTASGKHDLALANQLYEAATASLDARGSSATIGFVNARSLAPLHGRAITLLGMLDRWRLDADGPSGARLRAALDAKLDERFVPTLVPELDVGAEVDALWATCRRREVVSVSKDARYLKWKYVDDPARRYRVFGARFGDQLLAVAVVMPRREHWVVLELVSREKSVPFARELLALLSAEAARVGVGRLRLVAMDPWYFRAIAAELEPEPDFAHHVFARAVKPERARVYENAASWTLTLGDAESI